VALCSQGLHTQKGENPELRTLFFKFCRLLKAPVTLVFVFDGPDRPPVKRGKAVIHQPPWLLDHLKTLIRAFGFSFHQVSTRGGSESVGYTIQLLQTHRHRERQKLSLR